MNTSTALLGAAALLLVSLAAAYMSIKSFREMSEEVEIRRMFKEWMAKYKKTYTSIVEEEHRYAVFKENRRRIDLHNADADAGVHSFYLGLNVFADRTDDELRSKPGCGGLKADRQYRAADNEHLPDSIDWRKKARGGRGEAVSS